jgi:hypothetical protein
MAKSIDGFARKSETAQQLFKDYFSGDASFTQDVKQILSDPSLSSKDVQNLTLAAFVQKLMQKGNVEQKAQLAKLLDLFKEQPK